MDAVPSASVSIRNRGALALLRVSQKVTQRQITRTCRVSKASVSNWISCQRKPEYANRALLQQHYQIPMQWWDEYGPVEATR